MTLEINVHQVGYVFPGGIKALEDISFTLRQGEFIGFAGPNASGKTTLARLLNASLLPTTGSVQVNGLSSAYPENRSSIKYCVALIRPDPESQLIAPTVHEELLLSLRFLDENVSNDDHRCEYALQAANLAHCRNVHPFYLSAGEQFRLLLASRLLIQPHYVVLDETLSMMDSKSRENALNTLQNLRNQQNLGIILFSHRLEDMIDADRIFILKHGRIEVDTTVASVIDQAPKNPDWCLEVPQTYQIYKRLSSAQRVALGDIFCFIPQSLRINQ